MRIDRTTERIGIVTSQLRQSLRHWPTRRRIGVPGYFLQWLNISEDELRTASRRRGLKVCSYLPDTPLFEQRADDSALTLPAELADAVTYALCVASETLPGELNGDHAVAENQWRSRIASAYRQMLSLIRTAQLDLVLVVQGFEPHNAAARCAAQHLGVPILAVENTAIANRMVWDNLSGITTNRNLARNVYWRYRDSVSAACCEDYCNQLIQDTKNLKSSEHESPFAKHRTPSRRPKILFLGQVYTDSSQVFGMRQWRTPLEILDHCARWCRQHQHDLVVKLHPKECSGANTIDGRLYDRLTYRKILERTELAAALDQLNAVIDEDNSYDTYALIEDCAAVVTVNSQAGLEAAIRGKGVVVCGDAFYGGLDFTCDAPHPDFFDAALYRSVTESADVATARRFAFVFFERYCREKSAAGLIQLIEGNL